MSIDRRTLFVAGLGAALAGCASTGPAQPMPEVGPDTRQYGPGQPTEGYSHEEITHSVSDFFGVASESVGGRAWAGTSAATRPGSSP